MLVLRIIVLDRVMTAVGLLGKDVVWQIASICQMATTRRKHIFMLAGRIGKVKVEHQSRLTERLNAPRGC